MTTRNIGAVILDRVFGRMSIDEEWSSRDANGFTWWGHRLRQRVWADEPRSSMGYDVVKVSAECDVLRNVPESAELYRRLAALNCFASLSSAVYRRDERRVAMCCSVYAHEETVDDGARMMQLAAAVQAADAAAKTDFGLAGMIGGEPDHSRHPTSGERADPDEMLFVLKTLVAPAGGEPSPFVGEDYDAAAELLCSRGLLASAGSEGLTVEFPCLGDTPASMLEDLSSGLETAMAVVSASESNPQLGSGALIRLQLPHVVDEDEAWVLSNELNLAEADEWAGCHHLGAWCVGDGNLTFVTFLPAIMYRPGLILNMLLHAGRRAAWAGEVIE